MRPFPRCAAATCLLLVMAACAPTLDELKRRPLLFSASTAVPFDTMTNCLAGRSTERWIVTPQIYPRDGVAYVTLTHPSTNQLHAEYTVRRTGEGTSLVEYRRREMFADLGGSEERARAAVERCSKAPA